MPPIECNAMGTDKTIPTKTKVILEYGLSSQSIPMIWEAIATAPGLTSWFADNVESDGKTFSFTWGKNETRKAELINCRQNTYVRFRWDDEEPGTFFEIRILKNDLTLTYSLQITDFADSEAEDDVRSLWDTSMESLRRCGL